MEKNPLNHNDVKIDFNRALSLLVYTYTDLKLSAKKVLVHQPRFAHKHLPLTQITTNQLQTTINGRRWAKSFGVNEINHQINL